MIRPALLLFFAFLWGSGTVLYAEYRPAQGAQLNFTQVLFEYDEVPGASDYRITITDRSGSQQPLVVRNASLAFIQSTGLVFGHQYVWYVEALRNDRPIHRSDIFIFDIRLGFQADTSFFRADAEAIDSLQYRGGIIFLDFMGLAVNRKGEPVWYMPFGKDSLDNFKLRNIRLTPEGTITYLDNTDCFEKDLYGNTLWKAPNDGRVSGDRQEYYHHDFCKLGDGSYLATGYRFANRPNYFDPALTARVRYNTLVQYDKAGRVLWTWDEEKQVPPRLLFANSDRNATEVSGTHLNGFAFDTAGGQLVLSLRDISTVLLISRRTGQVLYNIGDTLRKYPQGTFPFSAQHGPSLMRNGNIIVYNNNLATKDRSPAGPLFPWIQVFSPPGKGRPAKLTWEYECRSDKHPGGIQGKEGYASQLPYGDNLLVSVGGAGYVFEVTPDKQVVWRCFPRQYSDTAREWKEVGNYRCSYASSLYPCYFTLEKLSRALDNGNVYVQFTLNNEGSDDQVFEGTLSAPGQVMAGGMAPVTIPARSSRDIRLPASQMGPLVLRIYPSGKPGQAKSFTVPSLRDQ